MKIISAIARVSSHYYESMRNFRTTFELSNRHKFSLSFASRMNMHDACIFMAVFVTEMHKKSVKPFTKDDLGSEDTEKKKLYIIHAVRAPVVTASARSARTPFFFSASHTSAHFLSVNNEFDQNMEMHGLVINAN